MEVDEFHESRSSRMSNVRFSQPLLETRNINSAIVLIFTRLNGVDPAGSIIKYEEENTQNTQ